MKTFTIETETNNIGIHASSKEAEAVSNSERFGTEAALAKLAGYWSASRLVEIWNSLPGETPVRKFKDRATAVSRIWKALQSLGQTAPAADDAAPATLAAPVAQSPETVPVAGQEAGETTQPEPVIAGTTEPTVTTTVPPQPPDEVSSEPTPKQKGTRAKNAPVAATTKDAGLSREGSKTARVIAMLKREGGTTLEEIMTAMGWQKHTTRAMLSAGGSLTKNHGLVITSEKVGDKRTYSIKGLS
jgi:hypothetical protein